MSKSALETNVYRLMLMVGKIASLDIKCPVNMISYHTFITRTAISYLCDQMKRYSYIRCISSILLEHNADILHYVDLFPCTLSCESCMWMSWFILDRMDNKHKPIIFKYLTKIWEQIR